MDFQKLLNESSQKPQKILKIVLSMSAAMLVMWLILVSQVETGNISQSEQVEVQERTEGLRKSLESSAGKVSEKAVEKKDSAGMFQNAFVTFLVLITLLGVVWVWSKKKGDHYKPQKKSREIDEHILGQDAQLKFLEVNDEVWVLGITSGSVNLLHRVPRSEWKETISEKMSEAPAIEASGKGDFKSFYKLFSN